MVDMFSDANDYVETMRRAYAVQSVIYKRDAYSLTINATLDSTTVESVGLDQSMVRVRTMDLIFAAEELIDAAGERLIPSLDDEVHITQGGVARKYRPRVLGGDGACWEYADPYKRAIRVHMHSIGEEV